MTKAVLEAGERKRGAQTTAAIPVLDVGRSSKPTRLADGAA